MSKLPAFKLREAIAYSPLPENIFRTLGILLNFMAEIGDVKPHIMVFALVFMSPDSSQ